MCLEVHGIGTSQLVVCRLSEKLSKLFSFKTIPTLASVPAYIRPAAKAQAWQEAQECSIFALIATQTYIPMR